MHLWNSSVLNMILLLIPHTEQFPQKIFAPKPPYFIRGDTMFQFYWKFMYTEIRAAGKIFSKICLTGIRDTSFSNMLLLSVVRGGIGPLTFLLGEIPSRRRKFKLLGLQLKLPCPPPIGTSISKILWFP